MSLQLYCSLPPSLSLSLSLSFSLSLSLSLSFFSSLSPTPLSISISHCSCPSFSYSELMNGDLSSLSQLFVCLFGFLTSSSSTRLYRGRVPRLTSDNFTCCHTRDRAGDHDFCLSRSHYTDIDPTSRERAATAGIEPRTSSPGARALPTELPRLLSLSQDNEKY